MDLSRVEELIELMRQSGVTQLSLELPDFKVSISRGPEGTRVRSRAEPETSAEVEEEQPPASVEVETAGLPVVAPVVGIFHNGGMLDPREIVREGDRVREGQLIAAIEAMKVPNELRAPVTGVISRLLVEDGAAVEYGQTLLLIDPEEGDGEIDEESAIGLA